MVIRGARFPDDSSDSDQIGIVYLQNTEQPEWLLVLQRLDKDTVIMSCTDYACLFSTIIMTSDVDLEWIFKDTRPITHLRITSIGPKLRIDMTGLASPLLLDTVSQPSALRQLLQSLTSHMFVSFKGAGKAERLQARLEDVNDTFVGKINDSVKSTAKTVNAGVKKPGQSLINPRVRKARPAGPQFADSEDE